jgi:hypothetical protein
VLKKQRVKELTQSQKGAMERFIIKEPQVFFLTMLRYLIKILQKIQKTLIILMIVRQRPHKYCWPSS